MTTNTIFHGNNIAAMRAMEPESVDFVFADPPYNTTNTGSKVAGYDKSQSIIDQKWENFGAGWDVIADLSLHTEEWTREVRRILKPHGSLMVCGSHHNIPTVDQVLKRTGWWINQWIAWCIPNAFPNRECAQMASSNQTIIWARPGKVRAFYNAAQAKTYQSDKDGVPVNMRDFWVINNDAQQVRKYPFLKGHGAKKPPALVARAIDIATKDEPGVAVYDPFLGTGTTIMVGRDINDWIPSPRVHPIQVHGSELYAEYVRMAALRTGAEVQRVDGATYLGLKDRERMRAPLGEWAEKILGKLGEEW